MYTREIRQRKYLHPVLFKSEQMEGMLVPVLTNESASFYNSEGINLNKCATCPVWLELRQKYHMFGITYCTPCVKDIL